MDRLKNFWESLTSTLWFVPTIMTFAALCLAFASIALDVAVSAKIPWTYSGGPEGAREVLSAIAASMITVAGVSFSVMIVALTLASQQFGPRLLRNFMRDTGNQIVLGTFIATFSYCLIVLRTIRSGPSEFVPHVSVTLAIVFALASLGVLIYFIHHAAVSIQAPELIAMVAQDIEAGMENLFPEQLGHAPDAERPELSEDTLAEIEARGQPIDASHSGYLQGIDNAALMQLAKASDLTLLVKCRPGDFVLETEELVKTLSPKPIDDRLKHEVRAAFLLGTQRTHVQDLRFSLRQLVEVAVRSLSPGVNDPFTAINCIDRIAAALGVLAGRSIPSGLLYDDKGKLRVIAKPVGFGEIVSIAFDSLRHYGRSSPEVTINLLEAIERIAGRIQRQSDRSALREQARSIERASCEAFPDGRDRLAIDRQVNRALEALRDRVA